MPETLTPSQARLVNELEMLADDRDVHSWREGVGAVHVRLPLGGREQVLEFSCEFMDFFEHANPEDVSAFLAGIANVCIHSDTSRHPITVRESSTLYPPKIYQAVVMIADREFGPYTR